MREGLRARRRLMGRVEYPADWEERLQEVEELIRDFRKAAEERGFRIHLWIGEEI